MVVFYTESANSQCNISIDATTLSINCGDTVNLSAQVFASAPVLSEDFNSGTLSAGWNSSIPVNYANPCGPTLDGTPAAWMGSNVFPRVLTTVGFDVSCGALVCFDLDFANDENSVDCEDPDQVDEGVYFEYSVDGGTTWNTIFYFEPTINMSGPYYSWANYCFDIPVGAFSPNTMFQWNQPNATPGNFDHWGIDNVNITPYACAGPGAIFNWDNLSGTSDPAIQQVAPQTTTTYSVTYTDGTNTCSTSVTIVVNPLLADATTSLSSLVCPNCADLDVTLTNSNAGSIVDDFDSGIDNSMWSSIVNGTAGVGCGGSSGNGLYFDGTGSDRYAQSIGINSTVCGMISFSMKIGSGSAPCENADAGEDVVLEYSTNGGTNWATIITYDESTWDSNPNWQNFTVPIPPPAQTLNTMFRWRQVSFSSCSGCDNWSLDNVQIACAPPPYDYVWSPATGLSSSTIQNPSACPNVPTTYTATITNPANGCSATDNVFIDVTCSCYIDVFTADISDCINGNEFEITGDYSYYINPGTGDLIIEATNNSGTVSTTINGPFTDGTVNSYTLTGLISDGSPVDVTIYFTDDLNCTADAQDVSPVLPTITGISGGNTYCQGDIVNDITVQVTGNSPWTVDYELDGVPSTATGTTSPISLGNSEGQYVITGVADQGCVNTATGNDEIIINPLPQIIQFGGGDSYCPGDPVNDITIDVSGTGPWDISYTLNGSSQTVTSANTPIVIGNIPGTYNVTQIDDANCTSLVDETDVITILPSPVVNAGTDYIVCEGAPITLSGSGASTYIWDNGVTNGSAFVPSVTTTYTVIGTDVNGCIDDDQITVTVENTPYVDFIGDTLQGCAPALISFTDLSSGNIASCHWDFGDGNTLDICGDVENLYNYPGTFDVSLTLITVNGCVNNYEIEDYIYIESDPIPSFNPSMQTLISLNTEVVLHNNTTGAVNYVWEFGDGSPQVTTVSPTHEFPKEQSGSYPVTLYAYSPIGCIDSVTNYIKVTDVIIYYIPNTFTPDGNEFNQKFQPVFTAGYDPYDFNMLIFDRWGEIIFESNDATVGWDGTYGGKIVPQGSYPWKIEFKTIATDERMTISGHVNVIR